MIAAAKQKRRQMRLPFSLWLLGIVVACFTAGLMFFTAPNFFGLSAYKIQPGDVSVLPNEWGRPFRKRFVNEKEFDLSTANEISMDMRRQYTYRFTFEDIPTQNGQVFVPYLGGEVDMYMNGVRIGGSKSLPVHFPGNSEYFISQSVPFTTYQTGINRLIIVMNPDNSRSGLPLIYFAPQNDISVEVAQFDFHLRMIQIGQILIGLCLTFYSLVRFIRSSKNEIHISLFGVGLGLVALGFLASPSLNPTRDVHLIGSGLTLGLIMMSLVATLRVPSVWKNPIELGFLLTAFLSLIIATLFLLPINHPATSYRFISFAALGVCPFAIALTIVSWLGDRRQTDLTNAELQKKVSQQEAIIAAQEKAIEDSLKAKGRLEERQRLTRDIHDGIGGQLLSLLVRIKHGEISQTEIENDLQYGLNDLRLIVDSMDHSDSSLDAALVTFRARAKAQLNAAKIRLVWETSDPFIPSFFGPAAILNIYRLMQEALTNVIRHSNCDTISVKILRETSDQNLIIVLSDNGTGFDASQTNKAGQGVKNMKYRAKSLGADFAITRIEEGGTEVRLSIPPTNEHIKTDR